MPGTRETTLSAPTEAFLPTSVLCGPRTTSTRSTSKSAIGYSGPFGRYVPSRNSAIDWSNAWERAGVPTPRRVSASPSSGASENTIPATWPARSTRFRVAVSSSIGAVTTKIDAGTSSSTWGRLRAVTTISGSAGSATSDASVPLCSCRTEPNGRQPQHDQRQRCSTRSVHESSPTLRSWCKVAPVDLECQPGIHEEKVISDARAHPERHEREQEVPSVSPSDAPPPPALAAEVPEAADCRRRRRCVAVVVDRHARLVFRERRRHPTGSGLQPTNCLVAFVEGVLENRNRDFPRRRVTVRPIQAAADRREIDPRPLRSGPSRSIRR